MMLADPEAKECDASEIESLAFDKLPEERASFSHKNCLDDKALHTPMMLAQYMGTILKDGIETHERSKRAMHEQAKLAIEEIKRIDQDMQVQLQFTRYLFSEVTMYYHRLCHAEAEVSYLEVRNAQLNSLVEQLGGKAPADIEVVPKDMEMTPDLELYAVGEQVD